MRLPEAGFIEWRLRLFGDRTEAVVAGPPALKERLKAQVPPAP